MHGVVSLAGGSVVLAEDRGVAGVNDSILIEANTCVMGCDAAITQSSQAGQLWVKHVHQLLLKYAS